MSGYSQRKFSDDEVRKIREEYMKPNATYINIALTWGVHTSTICKMVSRITYKKVKND